MIYSIGMTTMGSYNEADKEYHDIMPNIRGVLNPLFDKYDIYAYTVDKKKEGRNITAFKS